ncbi:MAG: ABC transporter permease [Actinomycetota bacterium]
MSLRPSWAIAKHEFRTMSKDMETPIFMLFMPLLMMALMKPLFKIALNSEGFGQANGSEQAVPGMAMMFASFYVGYMGFAFFRDHGWGTWERLRASPARPMEIMGGKLLPPLTISIVQLLTLFTLGVWWFGLELPESVGALALVSGALTLCLMAFGVMVTALCRTSQQLSAIGGLGSMLFGVLGGGFVPISAMPAWAQNVAPVLPTYWAMKSFRSILLTDAGVGSVAGAVAIMLGFSVVFAVVAATKFRFEETKIYYG